MTKDVCRPLLQTLSEAAGALQHLAYVFRQERGDVPMLLPCVTESPQIVSSSFKPSLIGNVATENLQAAAVLLNKIFSAVTNDSVSENKDRTERQQNSKQATASFLYLPQEIRRGTCSGACRTARHRTAHTSPRRRSS